jgi:protein-L-isoaspartate(D-aspartate) O-methyltransferase
MADSGTAGTADEAFERQQALVDKLIRDGNLTDPRVEAAFRAVPRHLFLPDLTLEEVYRDDAIPTKRLPDGEVVSSSSQPAIMAIMLEQLALEPGQRVLEIGAGTGYNAALIAYILGETGQIIAIDIDEDIVRAARDHLAAAGFGSVLVVQGDGAHGYPEAAPYDRIILTVAAWDLAPAWHEQLGPDGRLVLPLDIKGSQKCVAFQHEDHHLVSLSARPCAFMGLRGALAAPNTTLAFGPEADLHLEMDVPVLVSPDELYALLKGPYRDFATEIQAVQYEIFDSLNLWLGIHEPGYFRLWGEGEQTQFVPPLLAFKQAHRATFGLLSANSLCALVRSPAEPSERQTEIFSLVVRLFGPDEALASRLIDQVIAWNDAGRPDTNRLHIRAYRRGRGDGSAPDAVVVDKHWTRLVLDWG